MMQAWPQWQVEVLTLLQGDFEEELRNIGQRPCDATKRGANSMRNGEALLRKRVRDVLLRCGL